MASFSAYFDAEFSDIEEIITKSLCGLNDRKRSREAEKEKAACYESKFKAGDKVKVISDVVKAEDLESVNLKGFEGVVLNFLWSTALQIDFYGKVFYFNKKDIDCLELIPEPVKPDKRFYLDVSDWDLLPDQDKQPELIQKFRK